MDRVLFCILVVGLIIYKVIVVCFVCMLFMMFVVGVFLIEVFDVCVGVIGNVVYCKVVF